MPANLATASPQDSMTSARTDLSDFASGLAARLPGAWTNEYQRHARYEDQFPRTEQLWDVGHVDHIVSQYVLTHDADLHGPDSQRLYVADRPLYTHQLVTMPAVPVYCRDTHAEALPFLRNPVSSKTSAVGRTAASIFQAGFARTWDGSHGLVMRK